MSEKNPYIHLFKTSQAYYVYDVNTNQICQIPESLYHELLQSLQMCNRPNLVSSQWEELEAEGLLQTGRPEKVEHPESRYYPFLHRNKMKTMILQVTQRCNLRCEYCIYSGDYKNRSHVNKDMPWEIAKQAMDYFIAHSRDTNPIMLAFYGGEPLLNLMLIKQSVEYIKEKAFGKNIKFAITTNGTLLTHEIVDFLVENNFQLAISLDGPESVHDQHRKFANSDKGSFRILKENYLSILNRYPEYAKKITFNTVLDASRPYKEVADFLNKDETFGQSSFQISSIDPNYGSKFLSVSSEYLEEVKYEYFLFLMQRLGKIRANLRAKQAYQRYHALVDKIVKAPVSESIGSTNHHAGPCVPGVHRLFVNAEGKFFPCERVSELSQIAYLGNVSTGVDPVRAYSVLNIGEATAEKCKNCWCYRFCNVCVKAVDGITEYDYKQMEQNCQSTKQDIEASMKEYCTLMDLGYDFYDEKNKRDRLLGEDWYE